jgi:hypothetical protein
LLDQVFPKRFSALDAPNVAVGTWRLKIVEQISSSF